MAHFTSKLIKHIKPKVFRVSGRLGFEDPYDTGMTAAVLSTFGMAINRYVDIRPVFTEEVVEGSFAIRGRVVLAFLLFISMKLLLSRSGRRAVFNRHPRRTWINII